MVDQIKTFEEVEKSLFELEDHLIKDMADPEFRDSSRSPVENIAKDIAAKWVRYTRMARQNGNPPRYGVAIKHTVALLGTASNYHKSLMYGREEQMIPNLENGKIKVPILDMNVSRVFSVKSLDSLFTPYITQGRPEVVAEVSFSAKKVQSCKECPINGKCDIVEKCRSYNSAEYNSPKQTDSPTVEEMRAFDSYARTVGKK